MHNGIKNIRIYYAEACALFLIFTLACNPEKIIRREFSATEAHKPYDLLIVPGYPYHPDSGWHPIMKTRLLWSVYLMKNGFAKRVMYSGGAVYTPYSEGKIMALFAEKLGVPPEQILTEDYAEYSVQNVYNARQIAKEKNWNNIAVATDFSQSLRFIQFRRYSRIKYDILPLLPGKIDLRIPEPKIEYRKAFKHNFVSITERKKRIQMFFEAGGRNLPKKKKLKVKKE